MTPLRKKLRIAMAVYIVMGTAAWFTLDGRLRWIVLILMAALAFKSWVAVLRDEQP